MRTRVLVGLAVLALTAGACTSAGQDPAPTAAAAPGPGAGLMGHEVRADSDALETWALLYEPSPWRPGQEVKVVWRTTGRGPFRVVAIGPRSQRVPPLAGPTQHAGSTWDRPGEEWGTFFRLDEPGPWRLQVRRGTATASLALVVAG